MAEWLLYREVEGIVGPVDSRLVLDGIADGRVPPDTKVRGIAETAWRPLHLIPVFSLAVASAPPIDPTSPRVPFEGFHEGAVEPVAPSLRPQVHDAAAWEPAGVPRPLGSRFSTLAAVMSGAALGLLLVMLASRTLPAPPAVASAARRGVRLPAKVAVQRAIVAVISSVEELPPEPATQLDELPNAKPKALTPPALPPSPRVRMAAAPRRTPVTDPGF